MENKSLGYRRWFLVIGAMVWRLPGLIIRSRGREKLKISVNMRSFYIGLTLFLFTAMSTGCASIHKTTKTTTTKTTVTYPAEEGNKGYLTRNTAANDEQDNLVTQKSQTTTTTSTETKAGHQSILGVSLHAIGWVIALPFRIVGGLIGWIF